jgi:hypothetical protein
MLGVHPSTVDEDFAGRPADDGKNANNIKDANAENAGYPASGQKTSGNDVATNDDRKVRGTQGTELRLAPRVAAGGATRSPSASAGGQFCPFADFPPLF